jgi:flagellar biosynthesis protein
VRKHLINRDKQGYGNDPHGQHPVTAVALGYDPEKDQAPRVLASGRGILAEQILTLARDNQIPIREDAVLAAALASVEIDAQIPPELYAVVAEVLAYVYRLKNG